MKSRDIGVSILDVVLLPQYPIKHRRTEPSIKVFYSKSNDVMLSISGHSLIKNAHFSLSVGIFIFNYIPYPESPFIYSSRVKNTSELAKAML